MRAMRDLGPSHINLIDTTDMLLIMGLLNEYACSRLSKNIIWKQQICSQRCYRLILRLFNMGLNYHNSLGLAPIVIAHLLIIGAGSFLRNDTQLSQIPLNQIFILVELRSSSN